MFFLIYLFIYYTLKVSGYPGSHGIPAIAGSIYPGQASLLDQADSWNHRPQEIPVWQPNMEVSWTDTSVVALCTVNTLFFYYLGTSGDYCRKTLVFVVALVFFELSYCSGVGVMTEFSSFWNKSSCVRLGTKCTLHKFLKLLLLILITWGIANILHLLKEGFTETYCC